MNFAAFFANWHTTVTAGLTALFAFLAFLAGFADSLGPLRGIVPADWLPTIAVVSSFSAALLHFLQGIVAKDAVISGNGSLAHPPRTPEEER